MRTLAKRLAWAREKSGLSQRKLSELSGLTARHVALIEAGERDNPELKTLHALADTLGISVGWLANGEGESPGEEAIRASIVAKEATAANRGAA